MRIWLFHTVINDNIGNYCQLGFLESTLLLLEDKVPLLKFQIAVMLICAFCLWQFFFFFSFFRESFLYRLQTSLASSLVGIA